MTLFLAGIVLLIVGYYTYGRVVEKILGPDDRQTPAVTSGDGVDFVVLPHWKNMLIQLLNIAGIGPVIGVIMGIKFGPIVFLLIPFGNILGGAVHDFASGMFSMRNNGCNLPMQMRTTLGTIYAFIMTIFMAVILLLVVAVFINVPANLIVGIPEPDVPQYLWYAIGAIFFYYILATLFPIDKIIGKIYPLFGAMLLIGTISLGVSMIYRYFFTDIGNFLTMTDAMTAAVPKQGPLIPCLFVTIACGILSGFHATQSPIVARTIPTERHARAVFYGMMVVEGVIAMIWAAGGMALYNLRPELLAENPNYVLLQITGFFLGHKFGTVTVIAVIILAVTSGDTALRSLRMSLAEVLKINQKPIFYRLALCFPLILIITGLLIWSNRDAESFNMLWRYFAWGNQVLAASTLMGCTVWLFSLKKCGYITLFPGMFMTFIVLSFILWSPEQGFGVPLQISYAISGAVAVLAGILALLRGRKLARDSEEK